MMTPPEPISLRLPGYTIVSITGTGTTSTVYLARNKQGERVAIKQANSASLCYLEQEWDVLSHLHSQAPIQGIPRILDHFPDQACLVMEYLEGEHLQNTPRYSLHLDALTHIIRQFICISAQIHLQQTLHGDLHEKNILITNEHHSIPGLSILDFGFSTRLPQTDERYIAEASRVLYLAEQWLHLFTLERERHLPFRQHLISWLDQAHNQLRQQTTGTNKTLLHISDAWTATVQAGVSTSL